MKNNIQHLTCTTVGVFIWDIVIAVRGAAQPALDDRADMKSLLVVETTVFQMVYTSTIMIVSARPDSLSGAVDELHPFQCRAGCFASRALVAREKLFLIM